MHFTSKTQLSNEAQLLYRFQSDQNWCESSLLLSTKEMVKKQIP